MVRIQIANQTGTAEALLNDMVAARDFARRLPCTLVAVPVEDGYEAAAARGCYDPMEGADRFAPKFAELNDDVLFGEVWSREDKLSLKLRSIVTMTALISKGIVDNSLMYHLTTAKAGIRKKESRHRA